MVPKIPGPFFPNRGLKTGPAFGPWSEPGGLNHSRIALLNPLGEVPKNVGKKRESLVAVAFGFKGPKVLGKEYHWNN